MSVRERAAAVLRGEARQRREAEKSRARADDDVTRVVVAAVESVEALADVVAALSLPEVAEVAVRAAWQRLEAAGIARDGAVGEDVDLSRHRVVKERGGHDVVAAVLAAGVTFDGRRVREAAVVARGRKESDGSHRD